MRVFDIFFLHIGDILSPKGSFDQRIEQRFQMLFRIVKPEKIVQSSKKQHIWIVLIYFDILDKKPLYSDQNHWNYHHNEWKIE
jgi:hypothetical protein